MAGGQGISVDLKRRTDIRTSAETLSKGAERGVAGKMGRSRHTAASRAGGEGWLSVRAEEPAGGRKDSCNIEHDPHIHTRRTGRDGVRVLP